MAYGFNQTGFTQGFGQTGVQTTIQPIKQKTQQKYPGIDDKQMQRIEELADKYGLTGKDREDYINNMYRQVIGAIQNQTQLNDRDTQLNNLCYETANEKDENTKQNKTKINRVTELAQQIKKVYADVIPASKDDQETINWFVGGLRDQGYDNAVKDYCNFIDNGDRNIFYKYNLESNAPLQDETGISYGQLGAGLLGASLAANLGLMKLGKPIKNLGKWLYNKSIPETKKDILTEQKGGATEKELEVRQSQLKEAEANLETAKKTGQGVDVAQQEVDRLTNEVDNLTNKVGKVSTTTADTAAKYGLVGTKKNIGQEALAKAKILWKDTIGPALEKATDKVNVREIVNEVIESADKGVDPDLKRAYVKARDKLNKMFRSDDYLSMSLTEVQNLKSEIQNSVDSIYKTIEKGLTTVKDADKAYANLRNELANKLKEKIQSTIEKSVPEIRDLYKDYADLTNIYRDSLKQKKATGLKKLGENWITQQTESRLGKKLIEKGTKLKNLDEKITQGAKTIISAVKGKGKEILEKAGKTAGKGVKVADPIGTFELLELVSPTIEEFNKANPGVVADKTLMDMVEIWTSKGKKKEDKIVNYMKEKLWDDYYKDYLNGDREQFDQVYTDEVIKRMLENDEQIIYI